MARRTSSRRETSTHALSGVAARFSGEEAAAMSASLRTGPASCLAARSSSTHEASDSTAEPSSRAHCSSEPTLWWAATRVRADARARSRAPSTSGASRPPACSASWEARAWRRANSCWSCPETRAS